MTRAYCLLFLACAGCESTSRPPTPSAIHDSRPALSATTSPTDANVVALKFDGSVLIGSWTEDNDGSYVPSDSKEFTPVRYRSSLSFAGDGTGTMSVLSEDDGHFAVATKWKWAGDTVEIEIAESKRGQTTAGDKRSIKVSVLTKDRLVIEWM